MKQLRYHHRGVTLSGYLVPEQIIIPHSRNFSKKSFVSPRFWKYPFPIAKEHPAESGQIQVLSLPPNLRHNVGQCATTIDMVYDYDYRISHRRSLGHNWSPPKKYRSPRRSHKSPICCTVAEVKSNKSTSAAYRDPIFEVFFEEEAGSQQPLLPQKIRGINRGRGKKDRISQYWVV